MKISPNQERFIRAISTGLGGNPQNAFNTLRSVESLPQLGQLAEATPDAQENNKTLGCIGEDVLNPTKLDFRYGAGSCVVLVMMLDENSLAQNNEGTVCHLREWIDQITDGKGGSVFERALATQSS
ncbi:MAG: hypothetical protein HYR97_05145 [Candidatus Melainabacteria bacterium]|nr:hypothetical protein [Candidatus Melainabacteria bacterium]